MANENEEVKNEEAGNDPKPEPKHHTWIGDIVEKIEEAIDSIDGDFPLSGGSEPHHPHPEHEKTAEEIEEEHEKEKSFRDSIDEEFPLSGGEK